MTAHVFAGPSRFGVGGSVEAGFPKLVDTSSVEPSQRLELWRTEVNRANGIETLCGTDNFVGRIQSRVLSDLSIHDVRISTPHIAARRTAHDDLCFVNVQFANGGGRFKGLREHAIAQNSMFIYDAKEPYELEFDGESESLVIAVPKSLLQRRIVNLRVHLEEPLVYDSRRIAMLADLMRSILDCDQSMPQAVEDALAEAVMNLLMATLHEGSEAVENPSTYGATAMLQRIKSYLNDNIDDPSLNPVVVAEAMGITVSYLHKIFLQSQTTLMQYVLAERLERCRRDFAKIDGCGGISHVAYRWGFNDASHFSRSFRKRFGVSPRAYRQQVLARHKQLQNASVS